METLYWHDYETFGRDPARDYAVQFAGVRTDLNLDVIGKPLVKYCKIPPDSLPHPAACLVNGLSPQYVNEHGVCEAKFALAIHNELNIAETCSVGYNSSEFDDEFTRYLLYRNLFNPYDHHDNKKGNSRWDLINIVRLVRALRPEGFIWPTKEDGSPTTRLEDIAIANNIKHEKAHDALSDVYALIELAKKIRLKQPKLFDFAYQNRKKQEILKLFGISRGRITNSEPVIHISSTYGGDRNYLAIVAPVAFHPQKRNSLIVYNLLEDPKPLLEMTARELRELLFTKTENLPEGAKRPPLHAINLTKCPVIAPLGGLRPKDIARLGIDLNSCMTNLNHVREAVDMNYVAAHVYKKIFVDSTDPDLMLYGGGFFSDLDRAELSLIRKTKPTKIKKTGKFEDDRLPEMVFRYRARNFPHTLSTAEKNKWEQFRIARLTIKTDDRWFTVDDFNAELAEIKKEKRNSDEKKLISELEKYSKMIV